MLHRTHSCSQYIQSFVFLANRLHSFIHSFIRCLAPATLSLTVYAAVSEGQRERPIIPESGTSDVQCKEQHRATRRGGTRRACCSRVGATVRALSIVQQLARSSNCTLRRNTILEYAQRRLLIESDDCDDTQTPDRFWSEEELAHYRGQDPSKPLLLAVQGIVFDVSSGRQFYGPDADYHCFAGRAATRALTLGSLEEHDISDDIHDFGESEFEELAHMMRDIYDRKYIRVGRLLEWHERFGDASIDEIRSMIFFAQQHSQATLHEANQCTIPS